MNTQFAELERQARNIRLAVLESVVRAKRGHLGGTYSCVDLLVALYYGGVMSFNTKNVRWSERDRFLIGKGHACLALYHIWKNLKMLSPDLLEQYAVNGGLGAQLDISLPLAEHNTGSLGHVIGIGCGMALAARLNDARFKVFSLLGDAECDEGSVWESAAFAAEHFLHNLIVIVDRNHLSVTEIRSDNKGFGSLEDKFSACGWECRVINGHDFHSILGGFRQLDSLHKPLAIIADTIKGKGVSFMENGLRWHHAIPTPDEIRLAREELSK